MKFALLGLLLIAGAAQAQVTERFSCRLNYDSAGYQIQLRNYENASAAMKPAILNVLNLIKQRCDSKTNEASCSKDQNCIGVNVQIRMVPKVIGVVDARTLEPLRELQDGSIIRR